MSLVLFSSLSCQATALLTLLFLGKNRIDFVEAIVLSVALSFGLDWVSRFILRSITYRNQFYLNNSFAKRVSASL